MVVFFISQSSIEPETTPSAFNNHVTTRLLLQACPESSRKS